MFNKQMFAERLKALREEKRLNQKELAAEIDISNGSISYYEKAERLPDIETAYKLSKFFGVSADYLIGLTDVKTSNIDIKAICDYTGISEGAVDLMHKIFAENKFEDETYLTGFNLFFGLSFDSILFLSNFYRVIETSVIEEKKFKALSNDTAVNSANDTIYKNLEEAWNKENKNLAFEKFTLYEKLNNAIEVVKKRVLKNETYLLGDNYAND